MHRTFIAAAVAVATLAGAVNAATLNGVFTVGVLNVKNLNASESKATLPNAVAARDGINGTNAIQDIFTYTGDINFGTFDGTDGTTIADWLAAGGGIVADLNATVGDAQLSMPNIDNGSATSTFFLFSTFLGTAADFTVTHDDGMNIFDDGALLGGFNGPNSQRVTDVDGFDGGFLEILYVATNGDPSVLNVDFTPVPLPASLPLLLAGFGGLALLRRRSRD